MKNNTKFIKGITNVFSHARLARYQEYCNSKSEAEFLSHYTWNLALSESLYPALQILEVALRNRLYKVISDFYKRQDWLEHDDFLYLKEQKKVQKAIRQIGQNGKKLSSDRIIAELSFGFWTSLFDSRYEHKQRLWPKLIKFVFPYIPARIRTRTYLSKTLNSIRRLRNRIYHYKPIWHWQDLEKQHDNIVNVLSWIEPQLTVFNMVVDRFSTVYKANYLPYKESLNLLCSNNS